MKPRHSSNGGSEEIKANIEETRAQMDDTLDELSERLQPRHIIDDIIDYFRSRRGSSSHPPGERKEKMKRAAGRAATQVKRKASDAGRVAYSQVREHPLPALLIGAGITMAILERYRQDEYEVEYVSDDEDGATYMEAYSATGAGGEAVGYASLETVEGPGPESFALPQHYSEQSKSAGFMGRIKEKGSHLKERAGERLHNMKEQAGSRFQDMKHRTAEQTRALRQRASERGAQLKEQAWHSCERGVDTFKRTADERPMAVGFGFLALGVLAGLLIPSTRKEDELVGPTRDRLVERSREVAEDAVSRGKQVARAAADAATSEARAQGLTPEALRERAQAVASRVKETTREEARHQQQELKDELKQS